jgi:hypothetical protein
MRRMLYYGRSGLESREHARIDGHILMETDQELGKMPYFTVTLSWSEPDSKGEEHGSAFEGKG